MKHYILRFLLIFACVSIPMHSNACWDDAWDDYYSYDDYDDYDDLLDDDDDYDDLLDDDYSWWDDDDDDWDDNNNVDYGDVNDDDYDIDGGELDDVVVTPDYDWGLDDDWWRVDYSYEEEDNDDDDWYYDNDDDNDKYCNIKGGDKSEKNEYTIKNTDKLCIDIKKLNKQRGFKQGTVNSCLFAGLTFTSILFGKEIPEGVFMKGYIEHSPNLKEAFENILKGEYAILTIESTIISIAEDKGFSVTQGVSDIENAIDNGMVVLTNINEGENNTHDIVIVGYNDNGYIGYDTDRTVGYYRQIYPQEIIGTYSVGLKK